MARLPGRQHGHLGMAVLPAHPVIAAVPGLG